MEPVHIYTLICYTGSSFIKINVYTMYVIYLCTYHIDVLSESVLSHKTPVQPQ